MSNPFWNEGSTKDEPKTDNLRIEIIGGSLPHQSFLIFCLFFFFFLVLLLTVNVVGAIYIRFRHESFGERFLQIECFA